MKEDTYINQGFNLIRGANGFDTARIGSILLHSKYNPIEEAKRYLFATLQNQTPSTIIILGPGLGYLATAAAKSFPLARIICVCYSTKTAKSAKKLYIKAGIKTIWEPGGKPILDFFRSLLSELDLNGLSVVEWSPTAKAFPEFSRNINQALKQTIEESRDTLVTTATFGRKWIRNAIRNVIFIQDSISLGKTQLPIVIIASGPSLSECLPILLKIRSKVSIWATPSALSTLANSSIYPDLVIMTDGGFYAAKHLERHKQAPIAMPLTASPNCWSKKGPVILIREGYQFETQLLNFLSIQAPLILPAGTVSASAILLAKKLQPPSLWVIGLDLCYLDVHTHSRPNLTEKLFQLKSKRTLPQLTNQYRFVIENQSHSFSTEAHFVHQNRYNKQIIRSSRVLDSYSNWFSFSNLNINRVHPSPIVPANFKNKTLEQFERTTSSLPIITKPILRNYFSQSWPKMITRKKIINHALNKWQDQIELLKTRNYLTPENSSPMNIKDNSLISFIEPVGLSKARDLFLSEDKNWQKQLSNTLTKCTEFIKAQRKTLKNNEPNTEP